MNDTNKLLKLFLLIFLVWLVVTYIPNSFVQHWLFIPFILLDIYLAMKLVSNRSRQYIYQDSAIVALTILAITSIVLNRLGV